MSDSEQQTNQTTLRLACSSDLLPEVLGAYDQNVRDLEDSLGVSVRPRDDCLEISGSPEGTRQAQSALAELIALARRGQSPTADDVRLALRMSGETPRRDAATGEPEAALAEIAPVIVTHRGRQVRAKTAGQLTYVEAVRTHDLVFCTGPAGTGKTYLAMAMAAAALRHGEASRVVLTRPIVEAGEELGFLPGDIMEKVNPYLRPLHDALHDVMGAEQFQRHLSRGTIEVAPLAYMRGRTLNDSFIVLDEAQNTTPGQMKMALTRLGFGSKMIVTGDVTQTDLPAPMKSGLLHAVEALADIRGLTVVTLGRADIVRHDLVQRIVQAYERADQADREPPPEE